MNDRKLMANEVEDGELVNVSGGQETGPDGTGTQEVGATAYCAECGAYVPYIRYSGTRAKCVPKGHNLKI